MAVEVTPLGFKKPDSATELVKRGADVISDNAQRADELLAALQERIPAHYDGGTPSTVYATEQFMDGGGV